MIGDTIQIKGEELLYTTEEGGVFSYSASVLEDMFQDHLAAPPNKQAIPDGVKFLKWKNPYLVVVHESKPTVRNLKWIAKNSIDREGPSAKYRFVKIALPYTITISAFYYRAHAFWLNHSELYFRNSPLTSLQDTLGMPILPNVMDVIVNELGNEENEELGNEELIFANKICFPPTGSCDNWPEHLGIIIDSLWNSGFNNSWDMDTYQKAVLSHPMLNPIENWEQNTALNEKFILEQQWESTGANIDQQIRCAFIMCQGFQTNLDPVRRLGNFVSLQRTLGIRYT